MLWLMMAMCMLISMHVDVLEALRKVFKTAAAVRVATAVVNGKVYSEKDWNTNSCVKLEPYRYSKVTGSRCLKPAQLDA